MNHGSNIDSRQKFKNFCQLKIMFNKYLECIRFSKVIFFLPLLIKFNLFTTKALPFFIAKFYKC